MKSTGRNRPGKPVSGGVAGQENPYLRRAIGPEARALDIANSGFGNADDTGGATLVFKAPLSGATVEVVALSPVTADVTIREV